MTTYISGMLVLISMFWMACSTANVNAPSPNPNNNDPNTDTLSTDDAPAAGHGYDVARGGVQITKIYYNQRLNKEKYGLENEDEWIILEAAGNLPTNGWWLNAGDSGQNYPLPDTIYRKLYIYTKRGPGYENDTIMTLKKGSWIWNNAAPDTAWLYDANMNVVDSMSYTGE